MGKIAKSLFGGDAPKVSEKPKAVAEDALRSARKSRTLLLETGGGIQGDELNPTEIKNRTTLLGN